MGTLPSVLPSPDGPDEWGTATVIEVTHCENCDAEFGPDVAVKVTGHRDAKGDGWNMIICDDCALNG